MNLKKKFGEIFNILLDENDKIKMLNILNLLYKKNKLRLEIILNIIKGLVLILFIDNSYFENYYNILIYISTLDKVLLDKINNIKLEKQFDFKNKEIENIILTTHLLLKKGNDNLLLLLEIIKYTNLLRTDIHYKIDIYKEKQK